MKIHPMIKEVLWLTLLFLICAFSACVKAEGGLVKVVADMTICTNPMFCQQQTSYGSGVVVGTFNNQSIVLTAGHVFQGHDRQGLPVDAQLRRLRINGHKAKKVASWVTSDPPCDFAIVLVEHNFGEVTPLSDVPPKEGDKVCISGFDFAARDTPKLIVNEGTITSVKKGEFTEVDVSSASGISGGPVVDKAGNVKGLLVHTAGIMPNFDFRKSILHYMRDANLPPPNPIRFERRVPPPKPDTQFSEVDSARLREAEKKQRELEAELAALEKQKKQWKATEQEVAPLPPEEKPEEEENPSLRDRVKAGAGKTLDAAEVGLSFADRALSNPLVIAALSATGLGTGLVGAKAGVSLGNAAFAWWRRRKKKKGGSEPAPETFPEEPKRQLHKRDTREAEELVRLGRLEGRDPLLDSFMGITFQDVLKGDLEGSQELTPELEKYARSLWDRVTARVESAAPLSTGSEYSDDWRKNDEPR